MPSAPPRLRPLILLGSLLAAALVGALYLRQRLWDRPPVVITTQPVVIAQTQPAPPPEPAGPRTFPELVRHHYPEYPTTQPLAQPLPINYIGHFLIRDPVRVDRTGHAWFTRPDAPRPEQLAGKPTNDIILLCRQQPAFVHWMVKLEGHVPMLILANAKGDGYELLTADGRLSIGEGLDYDWARAFSWDQRIVVPTKHGASVFTIEKKQVLESPSPALAEGEHAPVQIAFLGGPIAWIPPQGEHPGSAGAVRCIENAWYKLTPQQGWPAGIIQLIPTPDGSVMQLIADADGSVKRSIVTLDSASDEEKLKIKRLIIQLSDMDPEKRDEAYKALTRYGPALWPIAESMLPSQPPETQSRIKDLLRAKTAPLLGGMDLLGTKLRLVSRHHDGGALFYAERGVSIPRGDLEPQIVTPAWLAIRPGQPIALLPPEMSRDLDPDKHELTPWDPEWIITDEVFGARTWSMSGAPVQLLRDTERAFRRFIGKDAAGRYYFQQPEDAHDTLVLDPTLPDPEPRLPAWAQTFENGTAGWDKNHWPAAKQKGAWAWGFPEWRVIDEKTEAFYSQESEVPPIPEPTTRPATSQPALGSPILIDDLGNSWFDGRKTLKMLKRDGERVEWELPAVASGDETCEVHLVRSKEGRLFLFNQPGRLLRLRPTPEAAEPFAIEATFTRDIPNVTHLTRMWLDPFGRICITHGGKNLIILFPAGYIPAETLNVIPTGQASD